MLARRADGLGERLNCLLNAMRLAHLLDTGFRFSWPTRLADDPHHAIVPAQEFFSPAFLAHHGVDHAQAGTGFVSPVGPVGDLDSLRAQLAASERGLLAPSRPLSSLIDPGAVPAVTRGLSAEFAAVGFHPRVESAMAAARAVSLRSGTVGIHLRAGDNLFGRYRAWTRYWYKVVPAPIARALIDRFRAEGRDVLLFGQDSVLIDQLCADTGAIDAATLRTAFTQRAEQAMFDLVLLSRCDRIISGWSGFAIQAASIADKSVERHLDLIAPAEAIDLTRADLARHGERYDSTHRAFAWWAAYYPARDELTREEAIDLVGRAHQADPTNSRYRLHLAALNYRHGQAEVGDGILVDALATDVAAGRDTFESVLQFSLLTIGGYDSEEILADIESAAEAGSGPASIYRAALRAQRGDADGARADADRFLAHAARETRLAELSGLDSMVTTTISLRLERMGRPA